MKQINGDCTETPRFGASNDNSPYSTATRLDVHNSRPEPQPLITMPFSHLRIFQRQAPDSEPQVSRLLNLPPELLTQILLPLLPRTTSDLLPKSRLSRKPFHSIIWTNRTHHSTIALLLTCRALHDLCVALIYGDNRFVVRTSYEGSVWVFRRLLEGRGLVPTEWKGIGDCFGGYPGHAAAGGAGLRRGLVMGREGAVNGGGREGTLPPPPRTNGNGGAIPLGTGNWDVWRKIRRWCVEVVVEDGYTNEIITPTPTNTQGMIKYGYGSAGLDHGVRQQVERLVGLIATCEELISVDVWLDDQERNPAAAEKVLEPFLALKGSVPGGVKVENVREGFALRVKDVTTKVDA